MSLFEILRKELEGSGSRLLGSEAIVVIPIRDDVANRRFKWGKLSFQPYNRIAISKMIFSVAGILGEEVDLENERVGFRLGGIAGKLSRFIPRRAFIDREEETLYLLLARIPQLASLLDYKRFIRVMGLETELGVLWIYLKLSMPEACGMPLAAGPGASSAGSTSMGRFLQDQIRNGFVEFEGAMVLGRLTLQHSLIDELLADYRKNLTQKGGSKVKGTLPLRYVKWARVKSAPGQLSLYFDICLVEGDLYDATDRSDLLERYYDTGEI